MENKNKFSIHDIALVGVMAAITCIMGPLSLPIGVVPISLTNLAIYLTVIIIGWKKGTISYLLYLLIGLVGVPVFSGFTSGPSKLAGPTGGYLIGFVFLALISGIFVDKFRGKVYMYMIGMIIGTIVVYAIGTAWLSYQLNVSYMVALGYGVYPFIIGDLAKILCAVMIGPIIRKQLVKAHVL